MLPLPTLSYTEGYATQIFPTFSRLITTDIVSTWYVLAEANLTY